MLNNKKIAFLSFLILFFIQSVAFAVVCGEEEGDDYYGNAQLCNFKNAIEGTEILTPADRAYLSGVEQSKIMNRWYARLLVGHPRVQLSDLEPPPNTASFSDRIYQLLLAGGKIYRNWVFEGQLLLSRKIQFDANPLFTGDTRNAHFEVTPVALFFDIQYIIPRWFSFQPRRLQIYLDAGGGVALKSTEVTTTNLDGSPRVSESSRKISLAGTLGAGLRYQVTTNILVDLSYRYYELGKTDFAVEGIEFKASSLRSTGFFIGAAYLF